MASVVQEQTVKITINGIEIDVPKNELIVESVKRLGLEVPIFCYHPRMKPVGMCRMCLVEVGFKQPDGSVRMMPKPQAACTLPASDGMVITTDSEQIHKDRKGVLEFLLINHPLDCPICDRGGECPLQNNTLAYGPSTSRFVEIKRHLPKAYPLSKYVTLDLERCIQCGRCVRFTEEISGDSQLAFRFRGASMQPSTYQLTDFESKFSGNVIEICPVGALTSSRYRFRARPWDLETKPGLCTVTPCGTNVWFDYRAGKFIRINGRTNEEVNEEWTADRCKFGHDFYNAEDRLTAPNRRQGDGFVRIGWGDALGEVVKTFEAAGSKSAVLLGANLSNEAYYATQKLFRQVFNSPNIDSRMTENAVSFAESVEGKLGVAAISTPIAALESQDAVLIFGTSLADEQPMSFLRVRKGWYQNGMKVVVAHHSPTDADSFAHVVLNYEPGTEAKLAAGLAAALGVSGAKGSLAETAKATGVSESALSEAVDVLKSGSRTILTTHSLSETTSGRAATHALAGLAASTGIGFNHMALHANSQGAIEMGALPDSGVDTASVAGGKNTKQILEACVSGEITSLWLVGCDILNEYPDRDLVERALENVETLVVTDFRATETASYASLILPMALPAEQDGTYTSSERRVQLMKQILPAPGDAKPVWRIMTEAFLRAKPGVPSFNPAEIMNEIAAEHPGFAGAKYDALPENGHLLPARAGLALKSDVLAGVLGSL